METFEGKKVPQVDKEELIKKIISAGINHGCQMTRCDFSLSCEECIFDLSFNGIKEFKRWLKTELLKEV